jgi:murein DD-endopeptidase MepM/ murein hydrolase activator NlpD
MSSKQAQTIMQRYGSYLVLLGVAALLFFGGRAISSIRTTETADTAVGDFSTVAQADVPVEATAANGQVEPAATIDLSSLPVLRDSSLSPVLNPYTYEGLRPTHQFITYTVKPLDTPNRIAANFGINPETLLGGNPTLSEESSALQVGFVLTILPINGLLHDVRDGDTLESVAEQYGVPVEDIIAYEPNNLEFPFRLYPNTQIVVPGAVRQVFKWTAPQVSRPSSGGARTSGIACTVEGTRTFIWPVTGRNISQYYWYGHQAIDVALPEGRPVVASDTGVVTWAGWNVYGYGNLVVVNHCNGYETYYAHLSSIAVVPGQVVYQGGYIAASGNTGRSSGPHLHFEIRYLDTLLDPLQWLR